MLSTPFTSSLSSLENQVNFSPRVWPRKLSMFEERLSVTRAAELLAGMASLHFEEGHPEYYLKEISPMPATMNRTYQRIFLRESATGISFHPYDVIPPDAIAAEI